VTGIQHEQNALTPARKPIGRSAYRRAVADPLSIRGLHQVAQRATDLDRAVSFYQDVLGLTFIARFDPPGLAFFDLGNTRLLLEHAAPSSILYLAVDDIDAAHKTLIARGVEFEGLPHLVHRDDAGQFGATGDEEWMAFFKDPDGNTLALLERRSP
jgi:methylmalonyl-CoA/ethylmalonyl-CoA epimerase